MTSFGLLETDSLGRFAFITNIEGKWNLILSVMEKGKKKDCRIILDRVFSPQPVRYLAGEMQVKAFLEGTLRNLNRDFKMTPLL
ncbi:hypothetical protein NXW09_27905 [Bacteroides ovatus]|nr:hypothetical protein [Bacteroides ovatus]